MSNVCGCNNVSELPIFRFQSTPQEPPTGLQIETSQKQVEDYMNRLREALVADIDCLCQAIQDITP